MFWRKRGIVSLALAGCLLFTAEFQVFAHDPQSEAQVLEGVTFDIQVRPLTEAMEQVAAMANVAVGTQEWYGKALANTDTTIDVLDQPDGAVVGRLFKNTVVSVEETGEAWSKISSGHVTGYVKNEMLLTGSEAVSRAQTVCADGTKDAMTMDEIAALQQAESDIALLAALIYCEAGNQPYDGKVAVGAVVMNRISSGRFPNTLRGVIYQRGQFTPAMTGKLGRVLSSGQTPASCYDAARDAMNGAKPVGGALFFNTRSGRVKLGAHYFS